MCIQTRAPSKATPARRTDSEHISSLHLHRYHLNQKRSDLKSAFKQCTEEERKEFRRVFEATGGGAGPRRRNTHTNTHTHQISDIELNQTFGKPLA